MMCYNSKMKENNEIKKLINKDTNQLFVFSSHVALPLSIARHLWIVISVKGKLHRYEVLRSKYFVVNEECVRDGHVYRDVLPLTSGLGIYHVFGDYKYDSRLEHVIELDNSINFEEINSKLFDYKCKNKYSLIGPNSNTYVKWALGVLNHEDISLPWNAFGKEYSC